jgi:uncharacterized protein (TIGR02246 family)
LEKVEDVIETISSERANSPEVERDELTVEEVVTRFVDALNQNDMKAFSMLFAEDADFVVVTGKYLTGRDEIVRYHSELINGGFKDTHLAIFSTTVRFLSPGVAVARVTTKRTENAGGGERTSFPMFVLTKQEDRWLIAAVQNTLISGPHVTPAGVPKHF